MILLSKNINEFGFNLTFKWLWDFTGSVNVLTLVSENLLAGLQVKKDTFMYLQLIYQ